MESWLIWAPDSMVAVAVFCRTSRVIDPAFVFFCPLAADCDHESKRLSSSPRLSLAYPERFERKPSFLRVAAFPRSFQTSSSLKSCVARLAVIWGSPMYSYQ